MKKVFSLILALSLFLVQIPTARAASAVPTAPSWMEEESYIVFLEDPAYEEENWAEILSGRQAAEQGGLLDYEGRDWAYGSPAQCYETGLIRLKCAENYGDNDFESKAAFLSAGRAFHAAESSWLDQTRERDETYYRLTVEKYRAYVLYHPAYAENLGRGLVPALDALDMTVEDFFDAQYMERVGAEDRLLVAQMVEAEREPYELEKNRITVELDGEPLVMDTPPQVVDQRVMVPIRAISEALGADVSWNEETWEVTMTRADTEIALTPGSFVVTVNGKKKWMDVAPYADRNRTYVSARYVSEFFGQNVVWNEEENKVEITEDTSAWQESDLEEQILAMGAFLGFLQEGDPAQLGFYLRTPYTEMVYSANGVGENQTVVPSQICRKILAENWNIPDRESLLETVTELLKSGDQKEFKLAANKVKNLSGSEIRRRVKELSEVDGYMWLWTKSLSQKWDKTGIRAWDLCRAAAFLEWGYPAGYVTYDEVMELLQPAVEELTEAFDTWETVYENFLEGYYWCLREDLGDKSVWETDLGMVWLYLKNAPDTRALFDDRLLEQ